MAPKQKIVSVFLLSIVLIVIVGVFRFTPLSSELKANYFWLNKFENTSKVDVVVYGDSRTYRGVSPDVLIEGTGLTSYNYGFSSGGYSSEIFDLIESRIDKTKDPIVVLGITPYSLTLKASENKFYHQENNRDAGEKFTRLHIDDKLSFFDRIIMDEYFKPNSANVIQEYNSDGWVSSFKGLIDTLSGLKSYESIFDNNQVSDSIVDLVVFNVNQWVSAGVKVFAFRPPTVVSMEILENDKSAFDASLFETEFEKAGGYWISIPNDGRFISYDASHLEKESAINLSRSLRKYIFD